MHVELTYDDYLWLDIQKHLLELEELTTDVTYSQIVYKMLMESNFDEDIVTWAKQKYKEDIKTPNLEYFDYYKNKTKLSLELILNTIKIIKDQVKSGVTDEPQKFFFNVFNRLTVTDDGIKYFNYIPNEKSVVTDKNIKTIYCGKASKIKIEDNTKATTVSRKT